MPEVANEDTASLKRHCGWN